MSVGVIRSRYEPLYRGMFTQAVRYAKADVSYSWRQRSPNCARGSLGSEVYPALARPSNKSIIIRDRSSSSSDRMVDVLNYKNELWRAFDSITTKHGGNSKIVGGLG